ncbi:MAG: hypothetical protein N4A40_13045 [Tissierellales bacterium]|nr:hypothetical protein [Tissierellales bacterium]
MSRKYDLNKIRDNFEVRILYSESKEINEMVGTHKSDGIKVLEEALKKCSQELYGEAGYYKTGFELYYFGGQIASDRLYLGDYDYSNSGILSYLRMKHFEVKVLKEIFEFLFFISEDISDDTIELLTQNEDLEKIKF